jgi:hypothetical protein
MSMAVRVFMVVWLIATAGSVGADEIITVRGERLGGSDIRIRGGQVTLDGEPPKTLAVDDVVRIELGTVLTPLSPVRVHLADGSQLRGETIALSGETLRLSEPVLGPLELPLSAVRLFVMAPPDQSADALLPAVQHFNQPGESRDRLVIAADKNTLRAAEGTLVGITDKKVAFRYRGEDRTVDRTRVRGVILAGVDGGPTQRGQVTLADGSTLSFSAITMTADHATLQTIAGERSIPLERLAAVEFNSSKRTAVTDLEPVDVRSRGFFERAFGWRTDKSLVGRSLQLGGHRYSRGLAIHSDTELDYRLDGQYATLLGRAGIDDAVRPHGLAGLSIRGDGKLLAGPIALGGGDEPIRLQVDVRGVQVLTLHVDFGPDGLGVADHVDLVDAWLIK